MMDSGFAEFDAGQTFFMKARKLCFQAKEDTVKKIGIYRIFAVYAENPDSVVVFRPKTEFHAGFDEDEAVLRSGIYAVVAAARKEPTAEPLDPRWVTIIAERVGDAKTQS